MTKKKAKTGVQEWADTSVNIQYNDILKTWEPNAPEFEERIYAVKEAIRCGHNVSISCEPLLDVDCAIVDDILNNEDIHWYRK